MIKTINSKPKIEDVMHEVLEGDTLKNGINYVAWLRENKMSPQWSATNSWKIAYKAHNVCNINLSGSYHNLETGSWRVRAFIGEYENSLLEEFKEIILKNIEYCTKCNTCRGRRMTIFDKELNNVCGRLHFINPDVKTLECIKLLISMRKNAITEGKAHKHR